MLKKLRWRFILAAMGAFFAVIVLIAFLVNFFTYAVITNRVDQSIEMIASSDFRSPRDMMPEPRGGGNPFEGRPDKEASYMMRFFIVRVEDSGDATYISTDFVASIDADTAVEYANKALAKRSDEGYIGNYRYAKSDNSGETVLIFLNASRELQFARTLCLLTIEISLASLILVFILVVIFSKKAIRPIENNIKQQKQFITDASHELKTPLTSISTSLDVITAEHGEDEWTDNIKKQTGRMTKLVSELVTLSRLDEDIPLPNKERFSLSNAAWETVDIYQSQAKGRGKKMTIDIAENVEIFGDKSAVQQMLSVLLDNAVRYSNDEGEIRFSVYTKKNKARIEVYNTCDYDTPPDVNRLFDRFYRPDGSRSSETGGTGVGLAIAQAVAESHGGTIKAICPDGKSMTIKVTI
jgi:signal transduction histidine kinase